MKCVCSLAINLFDFTIAKQTKLNRYFWNHTLILQLKSTNFTNFDAVGDLLSTLHNIFTEFKSHEQIENRLIMKKLKNKLKKLSIKNSAVCNCHKVRVHFTFFLYNAFSIVFFSSFSG